MSSKSKEDILLHSKNANNENDEKLDSMHNQYLSFNVLTITHFSLSMRVISAKSKSAHSITTPCRLDLAVTL